jgi:hypothetical protein
MQPGVPVLQPYACADFIPQSGIYEFGYRAGKLYRHGRGTKKLQQGHHAATTLATVGLTIAETLATAWVPATAWTRTRAWTPVTVGATAEETPATAWVPATA